MKRVDASHPGDAADDDATIARPARALPDDPAEPDATIARDADLTAVPELPAVDEAHRVDTDLTAVRADHVYDPTIPRAAIDVTDDTVAASDIRSGPELPGEPPERPGEHPQTDAAAAPEATWFVPSGASTVPPVPPLAGPVHNPPLAGPVHKTTSPADRPAQGTDDVEPRLNRVPRRRRSARRPQPTRKGHSGRASGRRSAAALQRDRTFDWADITRDQDLTRGPATSKARTAATWLKEIAIVVVAAMVLTTLVRSFIFQPFAVPSASMQNTLMISDKIVVSKAAGFTRGDVVVFRDDHGWLPPSQAESGPIRRVFEGIGLLPRSTDEHLVKRVVGMPGDVVACCTDQGQLTINGLPLDEVSYLHPQTEGQLVAAAVPFEVTVPADHVFVLGDNRMDSADSRCHLAPDPHGAFIAMDAVLGPVNMIVAPVGRWEYLSPPTVYDTVPDPPGPPPQEPIVRSEGGC